MPAMRIAFLAVDWRWEDPAGQFASFSYAARKLEASVRSAPDLVDVETHVIDLKTDDPDAFFEEIRRVRPTLLACSAYIWSIATFLEVARRAKEWDPSIRVVLGGPAARVSLLSLAPYRPLLRYVDAIATGEGEEVIRALARDDTLETIPDLILPHPLGFRSTAPGERPELESLPVPLPDRDGARRSHRLHRDVPWMPDELRVLPVGRPARRSRLWRGVPGGPPSRSGRGSRHQRLLHRCGVQPERPRLPQPDGGRARGEGALEVRRTRALLSDAPQGRAPRVSHARRQASGQHRHPELRCRGAPQARQAVRPRALRAGAEGPARTHSHRRRDHLRASGGQPRVVPPDRRQDPGARRQRPDLLPDGPA